MPTYLSGDDSFFNAPAARARMEEFYQAYLERLPIGTELLSVDTSFGRTNVLRLGQAGAPALVLLHGRNACGPLLIPHFLELLPRFRLYALDLPGQPNLSAEVRLPFRTNAYGQWLHEILSKLGVWYANLVGIDLGAYAILKSLQFDARRVAAAYLISPLGLHAANRWQHYWQQQRPFQRFGKHPTAKNLRRLGEATGLKREDDLLDFWEAVLPHYRADTVYIPPFEAATLRGLHSPVYCFVGSDTGYFGGQQTRRQIPGLNAEIRLPDCGYLPSPQAYGTIRDCIASTFQKHRRQATKRSGTVF